MRALVVHPGAEFSVADVHNGWVSGLRQIGCEVASFNLNDRLEFYANAQLESETGEFHKAFPTEAAVALALKGLEAACYEYWPDIVLYISGFYLDECVCELIRKRGHKLVLVHTESPYEDDRQMHAAGWADVNIVNDPTNIDRFREHAPSVYLPHCYNPDIHHPREPIAGMEVDFCFVGTGFPSRIEFFEQVDWTGINVQLAGNWLAASESSPLAPFLVDPHGGGCDNKETAQRYASALTSANLYRLEANRPELSQGWAMGPREVELAACGTWFARNPRGESDALLPMLPTFSTPDELGSLIRWALEHPEKRHDATVKAFAAITDRTFDRNAAELLNLLDL